VNRLGQVRQYGGVVTSGCSGTSQPSRPRSTRRVYSFSVRSNGETGDSWISYRIGAHCSVLRSLHLYDY